jgi:hypothetical protein
MEKKMTDLCAKMKISCVIIFVIEIFIFIYVICRLSDDIEYLNHRCAFLERMQTMYAENFKELLDVLNTRR